MAKNCVCSSIRFELRWFLHFPNLFTSQTPYNQAYEVVFYCQKAIALYVITIILSPPGIQISTLPLTLKMFVWSLSSQKRVQNVTSIFEGTMRLPWHGFSLAVEKPQAKKMCQDSVRKPSLHYNSSKMNLVLRLKKLRLPFNYCACQLKATFEIHVSKFSSTERPTGQK